MTQTFWNLTSLKSPVFLQKCLFSIQKCYDSEIKQHLWHLSVCVSAHMEEQQQRVEEQVEVLLRGQGWEVDGCDVGLEHSKPAILRKNVTYIVCAVIFNDKVPRADNFLFLMTVTSDKC